MAQYQIGKITVTQGSPVVTGTATYWTTSGISAGDLFMSAATGVWYTIKSVDSDTQITLASNYGQATSAAPASYAVQVDFTPNQNYPIPSFGDVGTAGLIAQTLLKIDTLLASLSPTTAVLEGQMILQGALQVSGGAFPVIGDPTIAVGTLFQDANGFVKVAKQVGGS